MGRSKMPRVLIQVSRALNACDFYRNYMPIKALDEHDLIASRFSATFGLTDCYGVDMVRVSRPRDQSILNVIEPANINGTSVVIDYDDDIFSVPTSNYCKPNFSPQSAALSGEISKRANAISTSTLRLKSLLGKYNDNICVIPNAIDWDLIESHLKGWEPIKKDFFHVVWAGSATHMEDQKIVLGPIRELLKKYDDIKFTFFGWCYNDLLTEYPDKINYHPMVNNFLYLKVLRDLSADLVIQPLINHRFNFSKSNIRWLESGSFGIPCLASDVPSFKNLGDEFCMTAAWDEADWFEKIDYAYKNREKIKEMGLRSQTAIKNSWSIEKMYPAWDRYYRSIWNHEKCTLDFTPDMRIAKMRAEELKKAEGQLGKLEVSEKGDAKITPIINKPEDVEKK